MPNSVDPPYIHVDISSAKGQMAHWRFRTAFRGDEAPRNVRIAFGITNGRTDVYLIKDGAGYERPAHSVMGFGRAMRWLSQHFGLQVRVGSNTPWTCCQRAVDLFGTYGEYVPPPLPLVATPHPVSLLRQAHAEYHARVRGEETRTRLGYCQRADCSNIAAAIAPLGEGFEAVCKAHEPVDPDTLSNVINLVRRNGRVFAAEVESFGYRREHFARAARDGYLELVKDGGMTRWVMAPAEQTKAVVAAGGAAMSPMFRARTGKHKATRDNRRYRKGA